MTLRLSLAWCAVVAALLIASKASAETWDISGSTVDLTATTQAGAVAEVRFFNHPTNSGQDDQTRTLTHGAITVAVTFTWDVDRGRDRIEVTAPDGFIAIPSELTLPEMQRGVIHIYPLEAVGV